MLSVGALYWHLVRIAIWGWKLLGVCVGVWVF